MAYDGRERRACKRFEIPGASASYRLSKSSSENKYDEEFCPVVDISRGGVKLQGKKSLNINDELTLDIFIPGEKVPLILHGKIRWLFYNEEKEIYQVGVQFNPYGEKKGQNYPGNLVKIIALEQKFSIQDDSDIEKFEVDS